MAQGSSNCPDFDGWGKGQRESGLTGRSAAAVRLKAEMGAASQARGKGTTYASRGRISGGPVRCKSQQGYEMGGAKQRAASNRAAVNERAFPAREAGREGGNYVFCAHEPSQKGKWAGGQKV